jgi:hypothetical protein
LVHSEHEQINPDYLLWGCFRWSFASSSTPAGCVFFKYMAWMGQGARDAKSPCATSVKRCEGFSIQDTLSSDSFQIRPLEGIPVDIGAPPILVITDCLLVIGYQYRQYATTGLHLRR